jgi:putative hydrolase of the HAD superfamily
LLLIFDLDDTLIDTSGSVTPFLLEKALKKMIQDGASIEDFLKAKRELLSSDHLFTSGKETLKNFVEKRSLPQKFLSIGLEVLYGSLPEKIHVCANKGVKKTLSLLHKEHMLAIVSVGIEENQLKKLELAGIDSSLFCRIICIDKEKKEKKKHYKDLAESFLFAKEQVLVCGDRPLRDLSPAKELGFTTVQMLHGRGLVSTGEDEWVDHKIAQFDDLIKILYTHQS